MYLNSFQTKKIKVISKNKAIKQRIIRDIKNLFKLEEKYYKTVRVEIFYNKNYTEYDIISNRKVILPIK